MANQDEVVIVSAVRTPFGRYCGSLREFDYFDLGAVPMREVLSRVDLDPSEVDEVFWGVGDTSVCKDVFTPVAARQTLLKAGLPVTTPSIALDKACVSAMSAVKLGSMAIRLGEIDTAIGGGATLFSQEPLIVRNMRYQGFRMGDVKMEDPLFALGYKDFNPVSVDSDDVAREYGIGREEMDEWALRSHENYGQAWEAGKFKDEIMPMEITLSRQEPFTLEIDEQYRSNITMEALAKLKPIYGAKAVTAGNAPGLNDGATAILFMSRTKAEALGLEPLATVVSMASTATEPNRLPEGPYFAMSKAMELAGITLDEVEVMEVNEAFAAVALVTTLMLADGDKAKAKDVRAKTNVNGGAIAIGHPNTASGARVIMNLMYELRRRGGGYALGGICGGLAQADAVVLKV